MWVREDEILARGCGAADHTTNNRMELTALVEAYRAIGVDDEAVVYTDSKLCVDTINNWAAGWEKRGWRRKGGAIKNLELIQELYALSNERHGVILKWIKAHDGSRWNEYVDALANAALRGEM